MVDLIIDGSSQTLSGIQNFDIVNIINGGILYVTPYNGTETTGRLIINATEVNVDSTSSIIGFKRGYRGGLVNTQGSCANTVCYGGELQGFGGGTDGIASGSGGGGYGTAGGSGGEGVAGGSIQGTFSGTDIQMGNGGGAAGTQVCGANNSNGEAGGAMLTINAQNINIHGIVNFDGGIGGGGTNVIGGGGASGGGILLNANNLDISGATITARGGAGGTVTQIQLNGRPGGAGRIKLFYTTGYNASGATITTGADTVYIQPMTIVINTFPTGASILIDSVDYGTTNKTIELIPGSYQLTLSLPCYETITETLNIVAGDILTITRNLLKNTGNELTINSTPSGADVYIDGIIQPEVTPITPRTCVPEGSHTYAIIATGYQAYRGRYNIVRSTSISIYPTLLPIINPGTGSIDIRSNFTGAEIFLDGVDKGVVTPSVLSDIPPGLHTVRLTYTGYLPVETTLTIDADTTDYVFLSFLTQVGSLSFVSIPADAEIYLALSGQTPIDRGITTPNIISDLPIELYDYVLRLTGYNDYFGSVTVVQGQITNIPIATLIPSPGCVYFDTTPQGAFIYLDDNPTPIGQTPLLQCGLSIGHHTYSLVLEEYTTINGSIDLTAEQGVNIITTLNTIQAGFGGAGLLLVGTLALGALLLSSSPRNTRTEETRIVR